MSFALSVGNFWMPLRETVSTAYWIGNLMIRWPNELMSMSRTCLNLYVPIAQAFSSNVISFHSAVAARLGLHVTDLTSLRLLEKGPLAAGELGEQLGLTGAAATALIDRLERAGYAVRERSAEAAAAFPYAPIQRDFAILIASTRGSEPPCQRCLRNIARRISRSSRAF